MDRPFDPPARRPAGRAIRRTDDKMGRLVAIDDLAVLDARLLWHDLAPEDYRAMIDARPAPAPDGAA